LNDIYGHFALASSKNTNDILRYGQVLATADLIEQSAREKVIKKGLLIKVSSPSQKRVLKTRLASKQRLLTNPKIVKPTPIIQMPLDQSPRTKDKPSSKEEAHS